MRVGTGWDLHRLAPGRPLILGGVSIASPVGLEGHSDADVLAHAVGDALLGALGAGDLGTCFPSSDSRWKGASGQVLLDEILVRLSGWRIENVDATLIAERPRLAEWRERIQASLALLLRIEGERVNVKLKSSDGLGAVGRGEGIAAQAAVLISRSPD